MMKVDRSESGYNDNGNWFDVTYRVVLDLKNIGQPQVRVFNNRGEAEEFIDKRLADGVVTRVQVFRIMAECVTDHSVA